MQYINSQFVNSLGLIFDLNSVIVLFFFGISPHIDPSGKVYLELKHKKNKNQIEKAKVYKKYSNYGLGLIGLGFLLQLISNFIK
jgi:hypothetical protein